MSIGLYRHPTLGETRKYILNNKYVLQIKTDTKQTEDWSRQLTSFRESFLGNKHLQYYLLPEEIYVDREATNELDESSKPESMRVIIYQHFVVTLKEELQMRIKSKEHFTKNELWFFLYAFCKAALEMIEVHQFSTSGEDLEINPQTILLNEYGYIKLVGYFSTPFTVKSRGIYKAPESFLSSQTLPHKLEICCSAAIGRILSSLILLKDLDEFVDPKAKLFSDLKLLQELKSCQERLGTLFHILRLMFADNFEERLMISEIKAMLLPYQDEILSLRDFTFDRETSRESMLELFVRE